jgi:hypothetical protein
MINVHLAVRRYSAVSSRLPFRFRHLDDVAGLAAGQSRDVGSPKPKASAFCWAAREGQHRLREPCPCGCGESDQCCNVADVSVGSNPEILTVSK